MVPDKSFLKKVRCLQSLSEDDLGRVAQVCHAGVMEPGTILMHKGENDRTVMFVLTGRARVAMYTSQGRLVHLEDAVPGMVIGEIAAISNTLRSATVEVTETSLIGRIPGDTFIELMKEIPDIAIGLLRLGHARLHLLTERYYENTAFPVQSRVHAELLRLCARPDFQNNTARITPHPTHEEIANRIGARRESVAREFSRLAKMGLLAKRGRQLEIRNFTMLQELARGAERS